MKTFFIELFEYNHHYNQEIITLLIKNQDRPLSNCLKLFSHIVNVHQTWNAKFITAQVPTTPWQLIPLTDLHEKDRKNLENSMNILDEHNMDHTIQYATASGKTFNNTVSDILFQVINHSTYHRAQIATECRQSGIEPLLTDYIFYKMK
jgi:uncharacterized damage-inducible protein DinB